MLLQMYVYDKFQCFTIRIYIMFNKKKKKMLNFDTDMTENNLSSVYEKDNDSVTIQGCVSQSHCELSWS